MDLNALPEEDGMDTLNYQYAGRERMDQVLVFILYF